MGCDYNMPNNAQNGTFEVCDADLKIPAGLYVENGVTMTYSQPASGVVDPPYTPVVPSSSNCVTYQSTDLYSANPTPSGASSASGSAPTVGSGAAPSTGSSGAPGSSPTNGAEALGISAVAGVVGVLFAMAFLS
ncbi:hypothetical protein BJ138DRAFT_1168719 [Hygrophoropsis aurantiaca]|uniref:Uncharacterized protein n=1 Tax=Hygrophoropsis aurantiaca TaxID=72124 RepID=A0ACB7ZP38_9AGAM|nr:hypothetical protein BJ138DRAFT_1168719 [Hygrophoropsis aurantiaca]